MVEYALNALPNIGYVSARLTEEQLAPLKKEINKIQKNFHSAEKRNIELAGNLENEFGIIKSKDKMEKLLLPYAEAFQNNWGFFERFKHSEEKSPLKLQTMWVNFQKKHEFNPWHDHSGILSFVIWIKIPYDINREIDEGPGRTSNSPSAGTFCFSYTDITGRICTANFPADKNLENLMIMFPSTMLHTVYPFYTSDDYRISVSGNFMFSK